MLKKLTLSLIVLLLAGVFTLESFSGSITGKINFKGAKPSAQKIKMNADPKCVKIHSGKEVESNQVVVNPNNTLKDVFVYVKSGLTSKNFPSPKEKVVFDQKGCVYYPRVFGLMINQPLEIINSDPTLHNVHALPKNSKQFNIAQPKMGMKMTQKFDKPEVMIKIKCEVHNWMAAYVGVLDHPFYAVSDDKGNFEIKNLPAGTYEIETWHEKFGTQTMQVTVGAADSKTADFTYEAK
jgi:hypothetical protein